MEMDRVIQKTQVLTVGAGPAAEMAATAAKQTGADTAALCWAPSDAPEGVSPLDAAELEKIILYPEGRVAGVMGRRMRDGMKLIVNTDALILTPEAARRYGALCRALGARMDGETPQTGEAGILLREDGQTIRGVYIAGDPAAAGGAGGRYALWVDETIYARFREHPMVETAPTIEGEYALTILGLPGVPKHHVTITRRDGVLSGVHETENDTQPMQDLRMEDGYLCWNLWAGTTSSELFTYHLKCYGGTWLGGTWRIDMENAHHTPVMMENLHPANPFAAPAPK